MKYGVEKLKSKFIIKLEANKYMNSKGRKQKGIRNAEKFKTKEIAERTLRFWIKGVLREVM